MHNSGRSGEELGIILHVMLHQDVVELAVNDDICVARVVLFVCFCQLDTTQSHFGKETLN